MARSFDQLMRQADLLSIAERALKGGAAELYDELLTDAEEWNYETIARHLADVRRKVPELAEDIDKFMQGIPLESTQ